MVMIKHSITLLFVVFAFHYSSSTKVTYNVLKFGAKGNGLLDSRNAFLKAWGLACASTNPAIIYVPIGRYLIASAITFTGQGCKSKSITINIDGTLVAPSTNYYAIGNAQVWIKFYRVNHVTISGGTLDAQGAPLWACKSSGKITCPKGATTLGFYHSQNIVIRKLRSLNSQMFHILLYACNNAKLQGVSVSAPGLSPNTDGIHLTYSTGITILNSKISTGDDCVSIGPGNSNIWIEKVVCGPGHGISIGSLGWELEEAGVQNVTVKTTRFIGTQNGVRIKAWARRSNGFVKDVVFQHATMINVQNPILIDANYCPNNNNCPNQVSGIKISNVVYEDVHGTSATRVAVKFDCSKGKPCNGIKLKDVNLIYGGQPAASSCSYVAGIASGLLRPTSCL
ncbi:polygalacturonase-like [Cynara cardunculus var. scolymus]|uniref:Glycoside hydrolase, family 28 n=1 Tax=Cynara cardunculus var. scolymus TaxID=59895 RepID=A0A103XHX4_CYNCS|nr:polygalacturonase-like [Cynara cardunculus var. scolymus]KVH91039.1 Glycoside hydrolase, family 28 [Cynara cardunculus var. scolymus]